VPPVASTAAQAIFEGFTRMPRARDGRTQGCVFVARTLSTRVRAVRVLDNMCVLAWCIDPEHFVLVSSAHEGGCKWGFGFILVRSKTPRVERDSSVSHKEFEKRRAHQGARVFGVTTRLSATRLFFAKTLSVTMSTAAVAAQVEQVRSAHALRLLEPKASAGTRTSGSPSVAAADDALELCWRPQLSAEQLLLAWRWCCRTHEGRVVCTRV